jgi:RNA polymerase sigma-70 factor, ECF subfamily
MMRASDDAGRAAERVARESYGRLVAFLAARTRDLAGAEDALADAFAAALRMWPVDGVPNNPDAWLLTVARRRQTDAARRRQTRTAGEATVKLITDEIEAAAETPDDIPDRRLALMFACAHPSIERGMRAPLILQTILGLTAIDIAAAFLIPPATMGQRLVRAKNRIKDAGGPSMRPMPKAGASSMRAAPRRSPTRPSGSAGSSCRCCPTSPRPRGCSRSCSIRRPAGLRGAMQPALTCRSMSRM